MTTRIFWLGMHKILIPTELAALRELGYEVFNPPYLSSVRDQSAELDWKVPPTTLPREVVNRLATYNFFYNTITDEIATLLNTYFDAVVVTINPDWLKSFVSVYKKTIIYRAFGQIGLLSEGLAHNGAMEKIMRHEDFWFVPHCEETAADEHAWLQRRKKIAPYWLPDDIFALRNKWRETEKKTGGIGIACPNITNPYYTAHFRYLKSHFEQRHFRYFGVQLEENYDLNVVGTLSREEQLHAFLNLSGFLYTYRERNVCYLQPIEMMVLGAPVLYLPGSLLHRYFGGDSPGLVKDEAEARKSAQRLIDGDRGYIKEITASQAPIVARYSQSSGLLQLRLAFEEIFSTPRSSCPALYEAGEPPCPLVSKPVLLLGHFDGAYGFSEGEYTSIHGIPRVMRQLVSALVRAGIRVVVTAKPDAIANTYGFYAGNAADPQLVSVVSTVALGLERPGYLEGGVNRGTERLLSIFPAIGRIVDAYKKDKQFWKTNRISWVVLGFFFMVLQTQRAIRKLAIFVDRTVSRLSPPPDSAGQLDGSSWRYVLVPHYYLFPEAAGFSGVRMLVYVPDYMPHFFSGRVSFPDEDEQAAVGRGLVERSHAVLTNSRFSAGYLSKSKLRVPDEKIHCFPLPFLVRRTGRETLHPEKHVLECLNGRKFAFYPTQAHPNKRLDLLVRSWISAHAMSPDLECRLVLTTGMLPSELQQEIDSAGLGEAVTLLPGITDFSLTWLYWNAGCLAFSSEMEGNFPTQILEALVLDCPIVTWDNPLIVSELGDHSRQLLIAPFADTESFARLMIHAINHRDEVLASQRKLLPYIEDRFSYVNFAHNVRTLDKAMCVF